jgi:hypothetical protein
MMGRKALAAGVFLYEKKFWNISSSASPFILALMRIF